MAIDTVVEAPSSFPAQFSQSRHFYLAVDRHRFKLETLSDLLGVAGRRAVPMVLCCSSRDELDAVCSAISNLPYISLASLETYLRRISSCLAADGIVINMVVGGEVMTLRSIEESSGLLIAEMPIHISEIL
ncbi:hypothetical protein IFM89_031928 [Coptis chinensis]|uniref:Uncharacterized protein n=1 Tax=Coptis chinensis TaxID=261450 RepID=A0A835MCZ2_9MAGN|nr:hypothetical protein IFM89_031928 [Coptis chinensis]